MSSRDNAFDTSVPEGFSGKKGTDDYWLDAVRDYWNETGESTDEIDLRCILNWFGKRRNREKRNEQGKDRAPEAD